MKYIIKFLKGTVGAYILAFAIPCYAVLVLSSGSHWVADYLLIPIVSGVMLGVQYYRSGLKK